MKWVIGAGLVWYFLLRDEPRAAAPLPPRDDRPFAWETPQSAPFQLAVTFGQPAQPQGGPLAPNTVYQNPAARR